MAHYQRIGFVPPKRHTQHRAEDGTLHFEEPDGRGGLLLRLLPALPPPPALGGRGGAGVGACPTRRPFPTTRWSRGT
ncbi:hypothetical protein [Nocardioides convexus]|uniref:hypothetical protein n=1 Tax=Nocardioides convexus TaxID=2712224 RepID=UPI002418A1CF|nr:hypothetical protein [Nocardioides convexus]